MTPQDFRDWRALMGYRNQREVAEALGVSPETIEDIERGKRRNGKVIEQVDRRTALACTALFHRLKPWGE